MGEHELRHLAVIAGGGLAGDESLRDLVSSSCAKALQLARAAFGAASGLQAFSWITPGLDRVLDHADPQAAARACEHGARLLASGAGDLTASLRVCGRGAPLPPATPPPGRALLWFRRYRGRDEIVRAAARFFEARPGVALADGDLDAWLDTAGVPDPDLLLLCGGTLRAQDALLWQGSYAEIWHTPLQWPALADDDVRRAVDSYLSRQRRFGR